MFSKYKINKGWLVLTAIFLIFIFGFGISYNLSYAQRVFPGVKINGIDVSNKNQQELLDQFFAIEDEIQSTGLIFKSMEKEVSVNPIVISTAPDLAQQILVFDWQRTVDAALNVGRSGNFIQNFASQLKTLAFGTTVPVSYVLDEFELIDHLQTSFSELEKPPINAQLVIKDGEAEVLGEESGVVFDYLLATKKLRDNITHLDFKPVSLDLDFKEPEIKKEQTNLALEDLDRILDVELINLKYEDDLWPVTKDKLTSWLEFQLFDDSVVIAANQEKVFEFLESIAKEINVETVDAKFELEGERVSEFQSSRDGLQLNLESSYQILNNNIIMGEHLLIDLVVEVDLAKVATEDLNDLGIKELLGRGRSDFSGSPVNRRHNIGTGVDSLNGVLIAPDEEFSLIDALGDIDGVNGYLKELVIKGDRTIPEYGGGLCQIGSTTFRAALWSGLPITARRNHSYRVRYYEPAGMDATIYDPAPDMKFLNDTGYHVLFIARMEGDELVFEFYGTDDGREVTIEPNPPSIYNVTKPGPPRYVLTDDLSPGELKRVESSHPGADTYFQYSVKYPDGEVVDEDFYSHYVAWRETWLVGRDPDSELSEEEYIESIIGE
ncbi:MAG: hypothetical protein CMI53_02240 [Parcubacteria group bacterium]|nr:hypothetical protein [Parcubacteria group bacterium]|tara:strand:+ start:3476 stop:5296 length:1821 start_codon:yes stop_codon:yes gene_type:complete